MDSKQDDLGLGAFQLCLKVSNLEASEKFYAALGFKVKEAGREDGFVVLRREDCEIGLFAAHVEGTTLNFRGGNTHAIAQRLAELGVAPEMSHTNEADGSGSVIIKDPDGHTLFFDSAPHEVEAYGSKRELFKQLDT